MQRTTHLSPELRVHTTGEGEEGGRGLVALETPHVLQPQGVGEVQQRDHGNDARAKQAVNFLVVVVDSRLLQRVTTTAADRDREAPEW